ncbi:hypothetical protein [Anaerotignum neopropionicum]|uniref:hypothetical protein n=1 Tax=Anaerotignum neopropionicum TaxID=36847 RepID=UPI0012FE0D53|nr:hypothetical protein [Anaerotignum neopropionicum]
MKEMLVYETSVNTGVVGIGVFVMYDKGISEHCSIKTTPKGGETLWFITFWGLIV